MTFFGVWPRQGFAGYWPENFDGQISEPLIPEDSRKVESVIAEYLGDPPRKPGKHGSFHKSAYSHFVRDDALELFRSASRGRLVTKVTTVLGRESEVFHQVWVTNFVDCLDAANSVVSASTGKTRGKIGVIKRAAFDARRWDGSGLFVLPQDPNYVIYCSEDFIAQWKAAKKKGIEFRRHVMDIDAILC